MGLLSEGGAVVNEDESVLVELDDVTAARIAKSAKLIGAGRLDSNIVGVCIACGVVITNEPPMNHRCRFGAAP